VKENVDPCPGIDATQIRPPCNSRMRLAIASPSPVPPSFFVIDESARQRLRRHPRKDARGARPNTALRALLVAATAMCTKLAERESVSASTA
jgi:hypothetical protein